MSRRNLIFIASTAIIVTGIIWSISRVGKEKDPQPSALNQEKTFEEPEKLFGFPIDSFKLEKISVKQNEMLSNILLARGMSYQDIDRLARKSKPVFDVRKMKAGNPMTFFWSKDSAPVVCHMVYEKNLEEYVSYTFGDSISVEEGRKEVNFEEREVSGVIESSLWNSMLDAGVSPKLSLDLSDVYQWTIDFFGLQKGDAYRVIYEVKIIDGTAIGVNRVIASAFRHAGREHWAISFEQDGRIEYFDEKGQSLRRAFLKAPLKYYSRVSSGYSNRRFHPILKIYRPHRGVDYAAAAGTRVQTIGDGKVVKIGYDRASGHYVKIRHNGVYTSGYMHLQRRPNLKLHQYVKQGDEIGRVGATGYATGPHLDFRIWKNGQLVNPSNVESPPVEPVAEENRARFDSVASSYMMIIDQLGSSLTAYPNTPE